MYAGRQISRNEFDRLLFEWLHPSVATYCQKRGRPYPGLDQDGEIQGAISGNRRDGLGYLAANRPQD